jgi:hypothetical protein
MSNERKFPKEEETLRLLRQKVDIAEEGARQAFDTNLFSDAKSFVYEVKVFLEQTEELSPELQQQLLDLAKQGWEAIISNNDNSIRSWQAHNIMSQLGQKIDKALVMVKKILIVSANPKDTDKLLLDEEVREIQAALKRANNRSFFEVITCWAVRIEDLHRTLLDHQTTIVHFSGHGSDSVGLALENNSGQLQLVSIESLSKVFKSFQEQVECILLYACLGVAQAEAIHQHIDYLVGINQEIGEIKFAIGFYDVLGAGTD